MTMKRSQFIGRWLLSLVSILAFMTTAQAATENLSRTKDCVSKEVIPVIWLNDVQLLDAISNLLRQLDRINLIVDPRVPGSSIGPGSRARVPSVKYRKKNVTIDQALQEILKRNKLVMITNPATRIVRLAPAGLGIKPVPAVQAESDTNDVHAAFGVSGRLDHAIRRVGEQAQLKIDLDTSLLARGDLEGDVGYMWENVTARQALAALLDNYALVMTEDPSTSLARISLQHEPKPNRKHLRRCTCYPVHREGKRFSETELSARLMVKQAVLQDSGLTATNQIRESEGTLFLVVTDQEKPWFARSYSPSIALVNDCEVHARMTMVDGRVVDTKTGKHGEILQVSVNELKKREAKAESLVYYGVLGGSVHSYDLRLQDGKWVVVSKKQEVVF